MTEEQKEKAFSILEKVYSEMPKTKGCERTASKNGCRSWCCSINAPSMFNVEFFYLWEDFIATHSKEEKMEIVLDAVKNYLRSNVTKGCVFLDPNTYKCKSHKRRPFACRLYALIHPAYWKKRVKRSKAVHQNHPKSDTKDMWRTFEQCNLVRTFDGRKNVSRKDEDRWFEEIKKAEKEIGIPQHMIEEHDSPRGSYRTIHDYVMMSVFNDEFMNLLSRNREERPSEEDIQEFAEMLRKQLKGVADGHTDNTEQPVEVGK